MTTRVLLVDDHPVVRRGVRATIEVDETITVAGEAGSGSSAPALADAASPAARPGPKGPAAGVTKKKKRKAPSRAGSAPPLPQPAAAAVVPQLAPPPAAVVEELQGAAEGEVIYLQKSKKRPKKVRR